MDSYLSAIFKAVSELTGFEPEVSSRVLSLCSGLVAKMFLFHWKIQSSFSSPPSLLMIATRYLTLDDLLRSYLSDSVTKRRALDIKSTSRTDPSDPHHTSDISEQQVIPMPFLTTNLFHRQFSC